ncbi:MULTISPECIES: tripartite tricarboxylate transporter substrate binding protein [unclassified Beijerinckia]|uniref:Bug family tripartite tricarboxylate transporter substrate binding protein n=1 Tax=unclassified Beijerinckia TaxID=2638183 RepID=UPI0008990286|nr:MULTISPECIES: tripartite tricarboxylate transporter substrate binding protein [unclassified Beijerinckia]MDH7795724.1 tripartite-type tricarboxylate transporter receptor subunit TctC [Beijerinckia sp. GAS462]SEC13441.1 Tripartite-type tricarboxylate transporter, receptor component TctC [Beijerinckia sp. 28-YEA-48]
MVGVRALLVAAFTTMVAVSTTAADWPSRPVKIIVPFGAGGQSDIVARIIAQSFSDTFKQQFFVENQGGGGGVIASKALVRAEPDGHTLMITGMATNILAPALQKDIGFDPIGDFTHIAYIGGSPSAFVVHPSTGVKTFEDFMAWAKTVPDGIQYVSPGVGSGSGSVAEFFAARSGIQLVHIPHRGGSSAVADLVAGHVKMGSLTWSTVREHINAKTLIPIAVSSGERISDFPAIPTFKEKGYPDVVTTVWLSLSGPRGLPDDITKKLNAELNRIIQQSPLEEHLKRDAFDIQLMTPAQVTQLMKSDYEKWVPAIRQALKIK